MAEDEKKDSGKKKEPIRLTKAQVKAVSPDYYGDSEIRFNANKAILRGLGNSSKYGERGPKRSEQVEELLSNIVQRFGKDDDLNPEQQAALANAISGLQQLAAVLGGPKSERVNDLSRDESQLFKDSIENANANLAGIERAGLDSDRLGRLIDAVDTLGTLGRHVSVSDENEKDVTADKGSGGCC